MAEALIIEAYAWWVFAFTGPLCVTTCVYFGCRCSAALEQTKQAGQSTRASMGCPDGKVLETPL